METRALNDDTLWKTTNLDINQSRQSSMAFILQFFQWNSTQTRRPTKMSASSPRLLGLISDFEHLMWIVSHAIGEQLWWLPKILYLFPPRKNLCVFVRKGSSKLNDAFQILNIKFVCLLEINLEVSKWNSSWAFHTDSERITVEMEYYSSSFLFVEIHMFLKYMCGYTYTYTWENRRRASRSGFFLSWH